MAAGAADSGRGWWWVIYSAGADAHQAEIGVAEDLAMTPAEVGVLADSEEEILAEAARAVTGKPNVEGKLSELVQRLQSALGARLVSVILYGSATTGDWQEKTSDLNVLCAL